MTAAAGSSFLSGSLSSLVGAPLCRGWLSSISTLDDLGTRLSSPKRGLRLQPRSLFITGLSCMRGVIVMSMSKFSEKGDRTNASHKRLWSMMSLVRQAISIWS